MKLKRVKRCCFLVCVIILVVGTTISFANELRWTHFMNYSGTVYGEGNSLYTDIFVSGNFTLNHSQKWYDSVTEIAPRKLYIKLYKKSSSGFSLVEQKIASYNGSDKLAFSQGQGTYFIEFQNNEKRAVTKAVISGSAMK